MAETAIGINLKTVPSDYIESRQTFYFPKGEWQCSKCNFVYVDAWSKKKHTEVDCKKNRLIVSSANDNDDVTVAGPAISVTQNVTQSSKDVQPKIYICKCHLCGRKFTERRLLYSHYQRRHTMKDFLDGKCRPITDTDWQCYSCHFYYASTYQRSSHDTNHCVSNMAMIEKENYEYDSDLEIDLQVTGEDRFFGNLPSSSKPKTENGPKDLAEKAQPSNKCPYCDHWSDSSNFYKHIEHAHGKKLYLDARQSKQLDSDWQCEKCNFWFSQKYNRSSHDRTQSCLKNIEMAQSINYVRDPNLKLEFVVMQVPKEKDSLEPQKITYKCHLCQRRFACRKGRDMHLQNLHSMKDYLNARCARVHDSDWQCDKCHFYYAGSYSPGSHAAESCHKNIGKQNHTYIMYSIHYKHNCYYNFII